MILHSIRWRLQVWLAFLLVVLLTGFGVAVHQLERLSQFDEVDRDLELRVSALAQALREKPPGEPRGGRWPLDPWFSKEPGGPRRPPPPDFPEPPGPGRRELRPGNRDFTPSDELNALFEETKTNGFYYGYFSRNGVLLRHSSNAPPHLPVPPRINSSLMQTRLRGGLREAYYFTGLGECVLVGRSVSSDQKALRRLAWGLLASGGTVLALGLGGAWWLTTRAMRPLHEIGSAAARIAEGDLSQRINAADTDSELGRLAGVLNSTFARLESAFSQQARFTADAAHELRTPVSVMLTHVQDALANPCTSEDHQEAFAACHRAAQRMRRLIESLLELARLDAGQEPMQREPLALEAIVAECVELVRPLAAPRQLDLTCDLAPARCAGDAGRLGQVITNLLTNAIHYNCDRGTIHVATGPGHDVVVLSVTNTGPEIPAADLPHVFDRFYRGEKARSGGSGRTGLGLAISKAIVEAHGGTITAVSSPGQGTTFTVSLPGLGAAPGEGTHAAPFAG